MLRAKPLAGSTPGTEHMWGLASTTGLWDGAPRN